MNAPERTQNPGQHPSPVTEEFDWEVEVAIPPELSGEVQRLMSRWEESGSESLNSDGRSR